MTLKFPHQWPVSRRLSLWGLSTASSSHNTIFQIWGRQVVYEIKSSVLMLIKILDLNFCGQLRQVLPHSTQYHTLFISSLIHFSQLIGLVTYHINLFSLRRILILILTYKTYIFMPYFDDVPPQAKLEQILKKGIVQSQIAREQQ